MDRLRKLFSRRSIGTGLMLFFTLSLVIPSLLIGGTSYETAKSSVNKQLEISGESTVKLVNSQVDMFLSPLVKELIVLSQQLNEHQGEKDKLLSQYQGEHEELLTSFVGTSDKSFNVSPQIELPAGYDPTVRPWYTEAIAKKGQPVITDPYLSATGDVVVTIAIADEAGTQVTGIDLNMKAFSDALKKIRIGTEGFVYVMDKTGKIVFHPSVKSGTDYGKNNKWVATKLKDASGSIEVEEYDAKDKQVEEVLIQYASNRLTGWKVIGRVDTEEVEKAASPIFWRTAFVIIASVIVGLAIAMVITRRLVRPLQLLTQASKRIEAGILNEDGKLSMNRKDEIGDLAHSFSAMSSSLKEVVTELHVTAQTLVSSAEEMLAGSDQTARATAFITESVQAMAEGTESQAGVVKRANVTMNEISTGVFSIAEKASHVAQSAAHAAELSGQGVGTIENAKGKMAELAQSASFTAEVVVDLGHQSRQIHGIVQTIQEIANQTNLLSLNAAIEAARAGENGRGFAVVAGEVKKLAEQSSASARNISDLIQHIQQRVEDVVGSVETTKEAMNDGIQSVMLAGEAFERIQHAVTGVSDQIHDVSAASEQVAASTEEVVEAMQEIQTVALQTASGAQNISSATEEQLASVQEISSSSESLAQIAEELMSKVKKFTL